MDHSNITPISNSDVRISPDSINYTNAHSDVTIEPVEYLKDKIRYRKERVMEDVLNHIKYDMDEEMGKEIATKLIEKFGLVVDNLRADVIVGKL